MIKRALGKTGLQVSEVAFGCAEIGMPYGIGVHSASDMLSETEAIRLLQTAFAKGINFFDTARVYGCSENIIGKAFKGSRHQVIIATKCSHFLDADNKIPSCQKLKINIESSLRESLTALQTDYVDIFMLHQADPELLKHDDVKSVFSELKSSGKIRATGVSTYTNHQTAAAIDARCWDVIQIPFNLMDQRQAELFDQAQKNGVGLIVRSVLLKGLLSDKGQNLHPALRKVEEHLQNYQPLMQQLKIDLATLATRFALSFPQVSGVLIGIDHPKYLKQALEIAAVNYLSKTELQQAQALAYPEPEFLNLPNWDKQGWLT
ncbi:aldo/keto reductase [Mucilaginibacter sp.]|uniref:aldo/keto reductase n=1 Tax=Mucilaginibacter sp. TaxID=1882438 RepID=UPI003B000482